EQALKAAPVEIAKLMSHFDVVTDIAGVDTLLPDVMARATELEVLLHHRGGKRIVRVVGRSSGAAVQLERVSRDAGKEAYLAFSLAEAEKLLDGGLELG